MRSTMSETRWHDMLPRGGEWCADIKLKTSRVLLSLFSCLQTPLPDTDRWWYSRSSCAEGILMSISCSSKYPNVDVTDQPFGNDNTFILTSELFCPFNMKCPVVSSTYSHCSCPLGSLFKCIQHGHVLSNHC